MLIDGEFIEEEGLKVLDFSPSRSLFRLMKKSKLNYFSSDLSGDFIADEKYDLTSIDAPSDSFGLIICYHVLEHIEEDYKAMGELFRILQEDGVCFIQTPFKTGEIYEDASITSPNEREKSFGQWDHVRIYSVDSLVKRLKEVGFHVEELKFSETENNKYGFKHTETVLICRKG